MPFILEYTLTEHRFFILRYFFRLTECNQNPGNDSQASSTRHGYEFTDTERGGNYRYRVPILHVAWERPSLQTSCCNQHEVCQSFKNILAVVFATVHNIKSVLFRVLFSPNVSWIVLEMDPRSITAQPEDTLTVYAVAGAPKHRCHCSSDVRSNSPPFRKVRVKGWWIFATTIRKTFHVLIDIVIRTI